MPSVPIEMPSDTPMVLNLRGGWVYVCVCVGVGVSVCVLCVLCVLCVCVFACACMRACVCVVVVDIVVLEVLNLPCVGGGGCGGGCGGVEPTSACVNECIRA